MLNIPAHVILEHFKFLKMVKNSKIIPEKEGKVCVPLSQTGSLFTRSLIAIMVTSSFIIVIQFNK